MTTKPAPKRIRVNDVDPNTGERRELNIRHLIIELRKGVEVEIDLSPHPRFAEQLTLFCPPRAQMGERHEAGKIDSFATRAGAANVLHVSVETHTRRTRGRKTA
jgi:hypothetical protein